jgi:DNA-binding XRE family transcriptional regulator
VQLRALLLPHLRVAFLPYGPIALKSFKRRYVEHPATLGEHLMKRRSELGLFQKDAAKTLRVNGWTYLGWEKDRKKPTARMMSRIIQFLGYDPLPSGDSISQQLLACRRILGLTQRSAAAELAIDEGTFWRYETGEWTPKGERLTRIQELLERAAGRARSGIR